MTLVKKATPRVNRRPSTAPRDGAGGTLLGIFIGLALGLAFAAGVAWTLIGGRTPAPAKAPEPAATSRDASADCVGGAVSSSEVHAATIASVIAMTGNPRKPMRNRPFDI